MLYGVNVVWCLLFVKCPLFVVCCVLIVVCCLLFGVGCLLFVVGCWLLVVLRLCAADAGCCSCCLWSIVCYVFADWGSSFVVFVCCLVFVV